MHDFHQPLRLAPRSISQSKRLNKAVFFWDLSQATSRIVTCLFLNFSSKFQPETFSGPVTFFWLKNILPVSSGRKSNPRLFQWETFLHEEWRFWCFFACTWNQNKANQFVVRMEVVISDHLPKYRFGLWSTKSLKTMDGHQKTRKICKNLLDFDEAKIDSRKLFTQRPNGGRG